jgi:maltokinase
MSRLVRREVDDLDRLLLGAVHEWLTTRRWFPLKGAPFESLEVCESLRLDDEPAGAPPDAAPGDDVVRVLLVRARHDLTEHVLQVPVVLAARGEAVDPAAVVGVVGGDGGRPVLDGVAHPRFVAAWLATAERTGPAPLELDPATARAISGEQSNTSVLLAPAPSAAPSAILKVLRTLAPGDNPDVDVPRRLAALGWDGVPTPLAWLEGVWRGDLPPEENHGHLGVLATFVAGARDGFELACELAGRSASFGELARDLGATVAGLHVALRDAYPAVVRAATGADVADAVARRLAWSTAAVPSLARYARAVEALLADVRSVGEAPPRQRVHGDLHLGQVLRGQDRWFVLDFEGEPAAPLADRTRPDLALRDVAGVLRSFDYAAAVSGLSGAGAAAWTADARTGLLAGYGVADDGASAVLLRALELDKALYEAVYESRNRPDWLAIPLAGLDRLLA